jgi:DNA-binding response OmpR family regulator
MIAERCIDELTISGQLRRDRGVRAGSKDTIPKTRSECGDQLALARRERRRAAHHRLGKSGQMLRPLRLEIEEVKDLGNGERCAAQRRRRLAPGTLRCVILHVVQEHERMIRRTAFCLKITSTVSTTTASPHVLVVDDHALDRKLMIVHLEPQGYAIDTAADGVEAWALLNADPDRYDVVLLDRTMPRMDGMQLLGRMKVDERLRMLPVIMQTALALRDQILEGIRAGAYYYLTKPYDIDMLLSVVRTAVSDYRGYRELQAQVKKGVDSLRLLRNAAFTFQTVEQAHDLGTLLASTCPDPTATVIGLTELLVNAVEHGNLGITYEEKSSLYTSGKWIEEVQRRLAMPEYASRQAEVLFERMDGSIRFIIRDQGTGFEFQRYMQVDPQRAFDSHGRGIAMANRLSFNRLEYRGCGNEVVGTIELK